MKHVFIVLFALFTSSLGAQGVPDVIKLNSFQLDGGVNKLKEENLHTKVHTGLLYGLVYEHTRQTKNISNFGIGLRFSRLKTKYEELSASANIQLFGKYGYLFESVKSSRVAYNIGPGIKLHYNLSYYPNWDESHLYWGSSLNFGISNKFKYQVNNNQTLAFDLYFSLFSILSRPERDRQYKIDNISVLGILKNLNSNLEAGTVNKSFQTTFRAEYLFHTSENITQAICYSYDYSRLKENEGNPFQGSLHQLGLKIYFR
ncbi:MAG: hypothetical protein K9H49_05845 [Bacteroidales bacterium]|nr:hypothetical protein [Bacteroidales bacterium]MCF8404369.1 hypothetical protein [Bacteroidales bacterium]